MKLINTALIVALTALASPLVYGQNANAIVGNGEIVKQQRTVGSFDKLNVRVGMRVRIVTGDAGTADLEGESNILEHVVTEVKNGELTVMLAQNKSYNQTKGVTVTIHVPKLDRILVSTGCTVESELPIKSNNLTATVETGSRLTAPIAAKTLKLIVRDGSRASLQGKTTEADIQMSGAGNLDASKLTVARADIRLDGASRADIHVTETLTAEADGVSTVNYTGNPTVKSQIANGLSRIRKQG
ncbi:head GIN domain-containing protein [Spirosoma fluminis]